jgi:hypothetical protein
LGHTFELTHAGVPLVPREPNCKPNYLSVMNYLFQLRGLINDDDAPVLDFSSQRLPALNEFSLIQDAGLGLDLDSGMPAKYRTGWYALKATSYLKTLGSAAKGHCDGSPLLTDPVTGIRLEPEMVRLDAASAAGAIDWNANGKTTLETLSPLDINFNGVINSDQTLPVPPPLLNAGSNDWAHIRLNQTGGRRNVGGIFADPAAGGRMTLGPLSLDVGRSDIGRSDIGRSDIGRSDIGRSDIGRSDIGSGDLGQGDIGRSDIGRSDIGRSDIGRGAFGGGDLDVGTPNEPVGELDLETFKAAVGNSPTPPNTLKACLTSDGACASEGGDRPVRLQWETPNVGTPVSYAVYRFIVNPEASFPPANLPGSALATVWGDGGAPPTIYDDFSAPAGVKLAYFVKANFDDESTSGISNFATVTTPRATIWIQDLGIVAPPRTLGGQAMTAFADDTRPEPTGVTTVPSPLGGDLTFNSLLSHFTAVTPSWRTWSHGYVGDVYFDPMTSLTMTLPAGTTAFFFYAEPNTFGLFNFTVTTSDGDTAVVTSGDLPIEGDSGAHGFGFYTSNTTITSIAVTTVSGANGFAVGEFGIAKRPLP